MKNYITIGDRNIDITSRDVEVLYLVTLDEYLNQTDTDIHWLIKSLTTDIEMLYKSREVYMNAYRDLPYFSDQSQSMAKLLQDISALIDSKEKKLNKYKGAI